MHAGGHHSLEHLSYMYGQDNACSSEGQWQLKGWFYLVDQNGHRAHYDGLEILTPAEAWIEPPTSNLSVEIKERSDRPEGTVVLSMNQTLNIFTSDHIYTFADVTVRRITNKDEE